MNQEARQWKALRRLRFPWHPAAIQVSDDGELPGFVMGLSGRDTPARFRVCLDGQAAGAAHGLDVDEQSEGTVTEPLYQLVRPPAPVAERTVEITFLSLASTRTPSPSASRPTGTCKAEVCAR